jgi:RNA polymerase sigma factor (sigma-70 family)
MYEDAGLKNGAAAPPSGAASDEECMRELTLKKSEALQPLFARYAPLVFHIASQSLGSAGAEDIVQDVFLSVWRKADTFDPRKGAFRSWLLQIAHYRVLNELRARSRRPPIDPEVDSGMLETLPDSDREPLEAAWQSYRQEAVRAAVDRLPPAQRQALSLAFFDELTHDQVAIALNLPLGTVKTRIRAAVQKLRFLLAPLGVAAVAIAVLIGIGTRWNAQRLFAQRTDRALSMVTASDITTLHLAAAAGVPAATHGSYRGRPGTPRAVIALHNFTAPPAGRTYQAWVRSNGTWTSMGIAAVGAGGEALLVAEGNEFANLPETIEVTLEPKGGSPAPSGPVVISWQGK